MSHTCDVSLSLVELEQVIPHFLYSFIAPMDRTWFPGASVVGREGRGGSVGGPRSSMMSVEVEGRAPSCLPR